MFFKRRLYSKNEGGADGDSGTCVNDEVCTMPECSSGSEEDIRNN